MKHYATALLVVLALAVSGCGGRQDDPCEPQAGTGPAGLAMRTSLGAVKVVSMPALLSTDYDPVAGPEELLELVDLVVDGVVTDIAEGRSIGAANAGPRRHFVVTIRPSKVYKAPGGDVPRFVHIEFRRPDDVPAADYRRAIPDGTRVVLFADKVSEITDEPVRNQFGGRDEGSALFGAAPQGLFIDMVEKSLPRGLVYPDHGIDGFKALDSFEQIGPSVLTATPRGRETASVSACA